MGEPLRLLHIEDSASDAALTERVLTMAGYEVYSNCIGNAQQMRAALAGEAWDVIIADYRLPEFDAPTALAILHETGCDIPFIVVSGAIGEEVAVAMMHAGAQDYFLKGNLARLAPAVGREIRDARTRRMREQAELALDESERRLTTQSAALERQTLLLEQRETMLREIHHRVKNNMQVISSLLSLQSRTTSNYEAKKILEQNQSRIHSMALLHEILYQSADLAVVDFPKYLHRMVDHLFRSYMVSTRQIRLRTELDPIRLALDDALPCGLLISEVLSNSLKHAFPEGRKGEIRIVMRRKSPTMISLELSDNGIGLPDHLNWTTSRSLGLRLVRALSEQIHASLDIRSEGGTQVRLVFALTNSGSTSPVRLTTAGAG